MCTNAINTDKTMVVEEVRGEGSRDDRPSTRTRAQPRRDGPQQCPFRRFALIACGLDGKDNVVGGHDEDNISDGRDNLAAGKKEGAAFAASAAGRMGRYRKEMEAAGGGRAGPI